MKKSRDDIYPDLMDIAREVAFKFLGKPYLWGGDDPEGFDCSGFCIEILKSVGLLPRQGDWTAQGLWHKFQDYEVEKPSLGCLVFWTDRRGDKIVHVEFVIGRDHAIGASGGGSRTTSREKAMAQGAYIKVRPYGSRKHLKGYLDPFKLIENI